MPVKSDVETKIVTTSSGGGKHPLLCSTRSKIGILLFFGCILFYCMRVNLSVAIVCMVNHSAIHQEDSEAFNVLIQDNESQTHSVIAESTCNGSRTGNISSQDGTLVWPRQLQGMILSSFYWGYVLTPVLGGWLAGRYGAKFVIFSSIFFGSVTTMFMPLAAMTHYSLFMALEILTGAVHGMYFSACHFLWFQWAPANEKNRLLALSYSGQHIGIVISNMISGYLCVYGFGGGWPSIFYIMGLSGFVWCSLWIAYSASSPRDHKWISQRECQYIEEFRIGTTLKKGPSTPWTKILTSKAVWAINIAHSSLNFCLYILLTNLPSYLKDSLKFDIQSSGLLSSLPYMGFWAAWNFTGFASDKLREKKILSVIAIRKLCNSFGFFVPSLCLVALTQVQCGFASTAVVLLIVGVTCCGTICAGFLINHGDIGPPFSGILFGISNTLATISGMIGPLVVGFMTEKNTMNEWQRVFFMAAGVISCGAIFYLIFGSAEIQSWSRLEDTDMRLSTVEEQGVFLENNRLTGDIPTKAID